jgi:hypothetical protein
MHIVDVGTPSLVKQTLLSQKGWVVSDRKRVGDFNLPLWIDHSHKKSTNFTKLNCSIDLKHLICITSQIFC